MKSTDEDGRQRQRHRDDREADFAGADERGGQRTAPLFDVPIDVLQHHDRIVDDELDREDERHHRQVVEAVARYIAANVPITEKAGRGSITAARHMKEDEDDEDHEDERQPHRN